MEIKYIIIHHSAVSRKKNPEQFDAIKKGHIKKGYGDIGYNFFIEMSGKLKEGRKRDKPGAHCYGHNHDSLGICLAGNFDIEYPTRKQEIALWELLQKLEKQYPEAEIKHHRDFRNTHCPGNLLEKEWHKKLKTNNKKMRYVIDEKNEQYLLYDELKMALNIGDGEELEPLKAKGLGQYENISSKELKEYEIYPLVRKSRWAELVKTIRDLSGF